MTREAKHLPERRAHRNYAHELTRVDRKSDYDVMPSSKTDRQGSPPPSPYALAGVFNRPTGCLNLGKQTRIGLGKYYRQQIIMRNIIRVGDGLSSSQLPGSTSL